MHNTTYRINGIKVDTQTNPDETAVLISSEWIASLSDENLVETLRFYASHADEISAIESVREYGRYNRRYWLAVMRIADSEDHPLSGSARGAIREFHDSRRPEIFTNHSEPETPGYVYVVGNRKHGLYKIGMTTREPDQRIAEFAPKLPFEVKLLMVIESETPMEMEAKLHTVFSHKRVRGEWFELNDADLASINTGTKS
jgi:hypothetical protein